MTILLSHTSALEALRRLGCIRQEPIGADAVALDCAPDASRAAALWESALPGTPQAPLHVQVPQGSPRTRGGALVTHPMGEPPTGEVLSLCKGLACPTPSQLLVQLEPRLTRLELLTLMEELMGTYAVRPDAPRGMVARPSPLLAPEELETRLGLAGSATNHRKLRWALDRAVPGSASPRESKLVLRLSLQASLGGYGLAVAGLNQGLAVAGIASGEGRMRRPDVLLARPGHAGGDRLVALEYDGEVHLDEERHAEDLRRTNELAAAGIAEYRVDKVLYKNLGYMDSLVEQIRAELGVPREHLSRRQREQRRKLRLELFDELEEIDGVTWDGRARERDRRKAGVGATPPQDPVEGDAVPLEAYGV